MFLVVVSSPGFLVLLRQNSKVYLGIHSHGVLSFCLTSSSLCFFVTFLFGWTLILPSKDSLPSVYLYLNLHLQPSSFLNEIQMNMIGY